MSGTNPHHWKVKFTTNMLIFLLIALIAVNSLVIFAFQVWFVYRLDTPEEALLPYSEAAVLDTAQQPHMRSWLLRCPDGKTQLLTLEKHVFLDQYRVVKSGTLDLTEESCSKTVWGDAALVHLRITNGSRFENYQENALFLQITKSSLRIPMAFFVYSLLLIIPELTVLLLIRKIRS